MAVSILSDVSCHLGEGPSYDPFSDTLHWFDILEKKLHGLQLATGKASLTILPAMGSAIFSVDGDRQLILTEHGFFIRYRQTGVMSLAIPVEEDKPATRSNDARAHPCGAIWFGTMGKKAEAGAGAIYHLLKGKVTKLYPAVTIPNAICFSPDGTIAYFTDTKVNRLMRVAIDPLTALPTGEPQVLVDHSGKPGGIDGAIVDTDGVIWNARWGIGQLVAISPDGQLLREIDLPAKQTTCPAFLGPQFNRIAVTSASEGYNDLGRAADPGCGKTFLIDLPIFGRAEPDVLF
jgi:sugar lactone lactonase YvrE